MFPTINPTKTHVWQKLCQLSKQSRSRIADLLSLEQDRLQKFTFKIGEFYFDFSKNDVNHTEFEALLLLAEACKLPDAIEAQFNGEKINETENRAVLHTALRDLSPISKHYGQVSTELEKMKIFSDRLINGNWKGYTGKRITDIVNIGIGGSDLGPRMVVTALNADRTVITPHFVSNVDATQILEILAYLDPTTTVFIIASKTFTTQETMTNANTAKSWFLASGAEKSYLAKHFIAVSTNREAVINFGIKPENMFTFWDWIGGRYSLWSAIGLSIVCTIGYEKFLELLKGARSMDEHFRNTPFSSNIPVISALIGIWYNNFLNYPNQAILPYDHRLKYLPNYLQQADMESNGKQVDRSGKYINYETGPILWGEVGTNGQHAFYQLLHQGTKIVPSEFLACINPAHTHTDHHEKLLANCFAQTEALMNGKTEKQVITELKNQEKKMLIPYKTFSGNRPSTTILFKKLTPFNLGSLIAYYEHKIFVQGVIWNIFSYDQWGVELGKQLAVPIMKEIKANEMGSHDLSTQALLKYYFSMKT